MQSKAQFLKLTQKCWASNNTLGGTCKWLAGEQGGKEHHEKQQFWGCNSLLESSHGWPGSEVALAGNNEPICRRSWEQSRSTFSVTVLKFTWPSSQSLDREPRTQEAWAYVTHFITQLHHVWCGNLTLQCTCECLVVRVTMMWWRVHWPQDQKAQILHP